MALLPFQMLSPGFFHLAIQFSLVSIFSMMRFSEGLSFYLGSLGMETFAAFDEVNMAVPLGSAAKVVLFEKLQTLRNIVSCGRRGT